MDPSTFSISNGINLLSAIGTMTAAIVALYLARSAEKVKLRIQAKQSIVVAGGSTSEALSVDITNIGNRAAIINNVAFSIGRRNKAYSLILKETLQPRKIEYGERTQILLEYDKQPNIKEAIVNDLLKYGAIKTLRLCVNTSVGQTMKIKLGEDFLGEVRQLMQEKKTG